MDSDDIDNYSETEITKEEYLKSLDVQDFLNCKTTRDILRDEHYFSFEMSLKTKLEQLFEKYANYYSCKDFLWDDVEGKNNSDLFSEIVYDNIVKNFDLSIFYENTDLAKDLFKLSS